MASGGSDSRIPVTVITGFLGAGKTTLINHILTADHGKKIAIIENEYGEIGIDSGLVLDTKEELYEAANGCLCCTVRGDLIRILGRLLKRKAKLDAIMIETTGLADPAPVAQTFFVDEDLKESLRLDAILTVVDAKHVISHLDEEKPDGAVNEAIQQVAFADKILLNKVDLVDANEKMEVISRLREINSGARIIECQRSAIVLHEILDLHSFDLDKILSADPSFLRVEETHNNHDHDHPHHQHTHTGVDDCKECAQGDSDHHHHHHRDAHEAQDSEECNGDNHNHKHTHHHDTRVSSVGIEVPGTLDMRLFNQWLSGLLQSKGQDVYRCKGILSMAGTDDKFVFHGVHMTLDFGSSANGRGKAWAPQEERISRAVFIGKELDRKSIIDGFMSCLTTSAEARA